jgi:hypothetical protein
MTMYLSNRDVRPTGYEAGEFVELEADAPVVQASPVPKEIDDEADEARVR